MKVIKLREEIEEKVNQKMKNKLERAQGVQIGINLQGTLSERQEKQAREYINFKKPMKNGDVEEMPGKQENTFLLFL